MDLPILNTNSFRLSGKLGLGPLNLEINAIKSTKKLNLANWLLLLLLC